MEENTIIQEKSKINSFVLTRSIKEHPPFYYETSKILLSEWGLPYHVSSMIVEQYIMKDYAKKVRDILVYGIEVRKNYYYMKYSNKKLNKPFVRILEPLWSNFDSVSSNCNCVMCTLNEEHEQYSPSCYVKKMIQKTLSIYYPNLPKYNKGTYEKYISYIIRKLTRGNRKLCKKNYIKIAKFVTDFGIKLY